jgi:hypothetical protein
MAPEPSSVEHRKVIRDQVLSFIAESNLDLMFSATHKWLKLPLVSKHLLLDCLAQELESGAKPGLRNSADLIIPYRIRTKELESYGHGAVILQDLFLSAGKAAWGIEVLLGSTQLLPEINEGQTPEQRKKAVAEIRETVAVAKKVLAYLAEPDYPTFQATVDGWQAAGPADRSRVVALLLPHLMDLTVVKPVNHLHKITINYRVATGDVERTNELRRNNTDQDLFVVGGKAAWAIGEITQLGKQLPEFTSGMKRERLERHEKEIQLAVAAYQAGLKHGAAGGRK